MEMAFSALACAPLPMAIALSLLALLSVPSTMVLLAVMMSASVPF